MSEERVRLNSLRIIQARGISRESQFEINDLGNVNVIFGRNGIGKSTVGLAIYKLLRPDDLLLDRSAEIAGQLQIGERHVDLRVAMSHGKAVEEGKSIDYPDFQSAGELSKYRLALEALIKDDDVEFAKVIADETRGGIDLRAVGKAIGANESPARPLKLEREYKNLKRSENDVRAEQDAMARRAQQLDDWKNSRQELYTSLDLEPVLQAYQEASALREKIAEREGGLAAYPKALHNLSGGESKELRTLQSKLENAQKDVANFQTWEAEAKAALTSLDYLAEATDLNLRKLKELQAEFADLQKDIRTKESERTGIEGKVLSLLSVFTDVTSVEEIEQRLTKVDLAEVDATYHQFVMRRQLMREAQFTCEYLRAGTAEETAVSREELSQRYQELQAWCGAADEERHNYSATTGRLAMAGSLLMVLWGLALAIIYTPFWLVALLVPLAISVMVVKAKPRSEQLRPTRQEIESAEGHRYPELTEWSPLAVKQLMEDLVEQINQSSLNEQRVLNFKAAEQSLQKAQLDFNLANERLSELSSKLGLPESGLDSEAKILEVVKAFAQWRIEVAGLAGVEGAIADLRESSAILQGRLTDLLPEFGLEVTASTSAFRAETDEASSRLAELQKAKAAVTDRQREVKHACEIAGQIESQIAGLLERLGVSEATVTDIDAWEKVLPEYTSQCNELLNDEMLLKKADSILASHPEVQSLSADEVRTLLETCGGARERAQVLTQDIQDLETRITTSQRGTSLANAMSAIVEKEDELRQEFQKGLHSLAGFCLVEHLIQDSDGNNSSWVLEQAAVTLHRITGGKLRLKVHPGESGDEFVISDSIGKRRDLESLSVGERVQVLLAVRLAFLSTEETTALPIVVDEALGTADDDRAHEIIESLVKLAKDGRQVFYFTAQTDEVEKWKAVLGQQEGVAGIFIDLDHLRGFDPNLEAEQSEAFVRQNLVPAPEKYSHAEYGERLGVSLPSARSFSEDTLSVWAVLDEVDDIYTCWQRRIRKIGMLKDISRRGQEVGLEPAVIDLAIIRAKALATALEEYWAGRALPVEMEDLIESSAFTERWLDPVWDLAVNVDCDGGKLIEALKAGRLKRFRKDDAIALEESLRERGKIMENEVSTPDQVEAAALAVFEREGFDLTGQFEWLLARLYQILGDYRGTGESDG